MVKNRLRFPPIGANAWASPVARAAYRFPVELRRLIRIKSYFGKATKLLIYRTDLDSRIGQFRLAGTPAPDPSVRGRPTEAASWNKDLRCA
jgi:hypothetical protein